MIKSKRTRGAERAARIGEKRSKEKRTEDKKRTEKKEEKMGNRFIQQLQCKDQRKINHFDSLDWRILLK